MALPYLIVRARGRLCALPVKQIVETLRPPVLAEVHQASGWLGTSMLRGQPVAVLDLGALLGFAADDGPPPARAVAMRLEMDSSVRADEQHARCSLFLVDEVVGVKTLDREHLQRIALPGGGELPMGRFDEGFARLVDASGLLATPDLAALFEAHAAQQTQPTEHDGAAA